MCSEIQLNQILDKICRIYNDVYGNKIVQVILYGSYARGDAGEDSDIDIAAIVHGDRRQLQNNLYQVWDAASELELEYGSIISPTVIPFDEFQLYKNDLPYYRNIDNEGVRINA